MTGFPDAGEIPPTLLISSWYGGSDNGVALVAESLAQSLERAAVPVAVLHLVGDGWWPRIRLGSGGETILSVCLRDPAVANGALRRTVARLRLALARRAIRRLVGRLGLRIAHFHYAFAEYGLLLPIVSELGMTPVVTFHGSDLAVNMGDPPTRQATEQLLHECGAATAVSDALRAQLNETFPFVASRAVTVHNSVPESLLRILGMVPPIQRDIDVLFVGNLIHRKGVDVLLRAFVSLRDACPGARLVIAGDGEERATLEELTRNLGLEHCVGIIGRQSREEIAALYRRARVLAVPSRAEPFGLVVAEGMLAGVAIVATAVGGIPEIVPGPDFGSLVAPDSPDDLSAALAALLTNTRQRNLVAERGRRHAMVHFTPDVIVAAYGDVYRAALARSVRNGTARVPDSPASSATPAT